jgi:hypothetical protein
MKRSLPEACLRGRLSCHRVSKLFIACGLLVSVMVVGCAGSLDPGVGGGGSSGGTGGSGGSGGPAPDCQVAIFRDQCASCHGAGTTGSGGLDLTSPNPETRLVGKMGGSINAAACQGMILLVPGSNPATGVFIDKITMNPPASCGMSMPYGSLPSFADQACLKAWATSVTMTAAPFTGEGTP